MHDSNSALAVDVASDADSNSRPKALNSPPAIAPLEGDKAKVEDDEVIVITDDKTVFRHFVALQGLSEARKLIKPTSETAAPGVGARRELSRVPVTARNRNIGRVVISRAAFHTSQLIGVGLPSFERTAAEREEEGIKRSVSS